jgi:hypothetical protein
VLVPQPVGVGREALTKVDVPRPRSTRCDVSWPLAIAWMSSGTVTSNRNVALSLVVLLFGYQVSAPCGGVEVYEPSSV